MSITLRPITAENWNECIRLSVEPEQKHFVASNLFSLAQAAYETEHVPRAMYDDEVMVGFAMYFHTLGETKYRICRLMVDAKLQRKGYGRAGMKVLLDALKAQPDCREIDISYERENEVARRLYASLGFEETGEIEEGEIVALLKVSDT